MIASSENEGTSVSREVTEEEFYRHLLSSQRNAIECSHIKKIPLGVVKATHRKTTVLFQQALIRDGTFVQRFVPPLGKCIEKTRAIYHNPRYCEQDPDFGIVITSKTFKEGTVKDYKVRCSDLNKINIYTVAGKPLEKYTKILRQLLRFTENFFEERIENVIADFVVDKARKVWLIDVVSFKIKEGTQIQRPVMTKERKISKRKCKCCGEFNLESSLQFQVAMSLARKASEHMQSRGLDFFAAIEVSLFV